MARIKPGGVVVLFLVALVLAFAPGCQRRQDVAEPVLDITPPDTAAVQVDKHPADASSKAADAKPETPRQVPAKPATETQTKTPPVALRQPPAIDVARALRQAAPFFASAQLPDGRELPATVIGAAVLTTIADGTPLPPSPLKIDGRAYTRIGRVPGTTLVLWRFGATATGFKDLSPALKIGQPLVLVAHSPRPAALTVHVASPPEALSPTGALNRPGRLLLLDRPHNAAFSGALLIDADGHVAGVLGGTTQQGLMAALSPAELLLWQQPVSVWQARYPQQAATVAKATPPSDPQSDAATDTAAKPDAVAKASPDLWLGLLVQDMDAKLKSSLGLADAQGGVLVTQVRADSPAKAAGLAEGDVLLSLGDRPLTGVDDLPPRMQHATAGQALKLKVLRDGQTLDMQATVAARPDSGQP